MHNQAKISNQMKQEETARKKIESGQNKQLLMFSAESHPPKSRRATQKYTNPIT